jgi:hypothetical protein
VISKINYRPNYSFLAKETVFFVHAHAFWEENGLGIFPVAEKVKKIS